MSVLERPFERVNYYNGERLEARDFRAEQDYLIRVRRLLNRSLYSPGIVKGLEVTKHPTHKHKVIVAPGLAFDAAGREIVVLDALEVTAMGAPSTSSGIVLGNFLVISYVEQKGQPAAEACHTSSKKCGCEITSTGPTRIRSDVQIEVIDSWPNDASGRIVLAQLELKKNCEVAAVHSGVRKYAVAAKPPKVSPISLEGEKDIDKDNPKVLYFHVEGGYPETATLVLRASKFSSLYYTELGKHTHVATAVSADVAKDFSHSHHLTSGKTTLSGKHGHRIYVNDGEDAPGVDVETENLGWSKYSPLISEEGEHEHDLKDFSLSKELWPWTHNHPTTVTVQDAGVTNKSARTGPTEQALGYVNDLHIWYDGADITGLVLQQLNGRDPAKWPLGSKLGDGTATHTLVVDGTKAINLVLAAPDVGPGEHKLEFKVAGGGGQLHHNLYVG